MKTSTPSNRARAQSLELGARSPSPGLSLANNTMQSIIDMYRVIYANEPDALEDLQELETVARVSPCQNVTTREI